MADNELLTPSEVAVMFKVNPKTVTRWARAGKISAVRTLGGHRRFRASEIRRFLAQVEELGAYPPQRDSPELARRAPECYRAPGVRRDRATRRTRNRSDGCIGLPGCT